MEMINWTEVYAWIFIGLGVWSVMIGSMLVWCWQDEEVHAYSLDECEALENEQWQRDQDEWERLNQ